MRAAVLELCKVEREAVVLAEIVDVAGEWERAKLGRSWWFRYTQHPHALVRKVAVQRCQFLPLKTRRHLLEAWIWQEADGRVLAAGIGTMALSGFSGAAKVLRSMSGLFLSIDERVAAVKELVAIGYESEVVNLQALRRDLHSLKKGDATGRIQEIVENIRAPGVRKRGRASSGEKLLFRPL